MRRFFRFQLFWSLPRVKSSNKQTIRTCLVLFLQVKEWLLVKRLWFLFLLCTILVLVSCRQDIPEPETKENTINLKESEAVQTSAYHVLEKNDPFLVKHHVKGKNVYIECIVTGISFRNREAKMNLYIDGVKKHQIQTSAFIVRDLKPGKHRIKLELLKHQQTVVAVKEFNVEI